MQLQILKKLKIPKDISKLSRSRAQQKCPEVLRFYDELIDTIRKSSYTKSIDFIDDIIKEPKLKFLLSLGFGGLKVGSYRAAESRTLIE